MKFENFEKAENLKKKIDALQQQLDEVKEAILHKKTPHEKHFQLSNYGTVLLKWEHLNWSGMLQDTKNSLEYQIEKLKIQFQNLD